MKTVHGVTVHGEKIRPDWIDYIGHMNIASRRVVPWPEAVLDGLETFAGRHPAAPWPEQAGHRMRVPDPLGPQDQATAEQSPTEQ